MPRNIDRSALDPNQIAVHGFGSGFRGYDQDEVRAYLKRLSGLVQDVLEEQADLSRRLAEAEERAARPPELTEDQLTVALGEETARVLSSARVAATEIRSKAEQSAAHLVEQAAEEARSLRAGADQYADGVRSEADDRRREAQEETERERAEILAAAAATREEADAHASGVRAEADERIAAERAESAQQAAQVVAEAEATAAALRTEAEAKASRLRAEAEQVLALRTAEAEAEVERIRSTATDMVADAERDAEATREAAREEGREMVTEVQQLRERMLKDLARRRKSARQQLEQLGAARERLLEAYGVVRQTVEDATSELLVALPEARFAAEQASRRAGSEAEATIEELEAEIVASRDAGLLTDPVTAPDPGDVEGDDPVRITGAVIAGEAEAVAANGNESVSAQPPEPGPATGGEVVAPGGTTTVLPQLPQPGPAVAADAAALGEAQGTDEAPAEGEAREDEPDVSSLFARIRAGRAEAESEQAPAVEGKGPGEGKGDGAVDGEGEGKGGVEGKGDDGVDPAAVAVLSRLEQRDAATDEIEHRLARKLKRVLADEQSTVLDAVRRTRGRPGADDVLPDPAALGATYADAASDDLLASAAAGAAFEGSAVPPDIKVDDLAGTLAAELSGQLRPRLQRCFDDIEGDEEELTNRIRSCYREWRSQRIVEATRHFVLAAFARGQYDATPAGTRLQWVVDTGGQACPDAEDNALAGAVPKGGAFPTGHCLPPAHPGCRCLVIAVP